MITCLFDGLLSFQIPDGPLKVRKLVVKVCDVVTRRAARLAAAGIVGILKKIGRDGSGGITGGRSRSDIKMKSTVVAIEGGLYTSYTMFREYLHEAMIEILGEEAAQHVILMVTEDGSGVGVALLAAKHSSNRVDNVQLLYIYIFIYILFIYIHIAPGNLEFIFHIFLYKGKDCPHIFFLVRFPSIYNLMLAM